MSDRKRVIDLIENIDERYIPGLYNMIAPNIDRWIERGGQSAITDEFRTKFTKVITCSPTSHPEVTIIISRNYIDTEFIRNITSDTTGCILLHSKPKTLDSFSPNQGCHIAIVNMTMSTEYEVENVLKIWPKLSASNKIKKLVIFVKFLSEHKEGCNQYYNLWRVEQCETCYSKIPLQGWQIEIFTWKHIVIKRERFLAKLYTGQSFESTVNDVYWLQGVNYVVREIPNSDKLILYGMADRETDPIRPMTDAEARRGKRWHTGVFLQLV